MKQTKILMGMPITVEIVNTKDANVFQEVFAYFRYIDQTFSTYKKNSMISRINRGEITEKEYSNDVQEVFRLCEKTKQETNGYFDVWHNGYLDPSGLVKGWSIERAAKLVKNKGYNNFYVEAGGDIQVYGLNKEKKKWRVGIKNPFKQYEIVKVVCLTNQGIATSGTYIRGEHIYNPISKKEQKEIVSVTVISNDIYDADRFATAAFAMGKNGITFLGNKRGLEAYMIDRTKVATFTKGFEQFVC